MSASMLKKEVLLSVAFEMSLLGDVCLGIALAIATIMSVIGIAIFIAYVNSKPIVYQRLMDILHKDAMILTMLSVIGNFIFGLYELILSNEVLNGNPMYSVAIATVWTLRYISCSLNHMLILSGIVKELLQSKYSYLADYLGTDELTIANIRLTIVILVTVEAIPAFVIQMHPQNFYTLIEVKKNWISFEM